MSTYDREPDPADFDEEPAHIANPLHRYSAFYSGKKIFVEAETSYKAQLKAAAVLKIPDSRRYMITVVLVQKANGTDVPMSITSLPGA